LPHKKELPPKEWDSSVWPAIWPWLALIILCRLVYWCFAYPHADSAYYWLWGQHLDWSYYDHPPLNAWMHSFFATIFGKSRFVLRLPNLVSSGIIFYTYYCLIRYLYGKQVRAAFGIVIACVFASPIYFVYMMLLAWQDQWLIALSLVASYQFIRFFDQYMADRRGVSWRLYFGAVCLGMAVLAKYTAVLMGISALVVIIAHKPLQRLLSDYRLYVAIGLALLAILPIVYWNMQNNWISFQYYFDRTLNFDRTSGGLQFNIVEMLGFWGFSVLIFSPVLSWSLWRIGWQNPLCGSQSSYWPMAIALFVVSTGTISIVALLKVSHFYWNILAYLLLLPLLPAFFLQTKQVVAPALNQPQLLIKPIWKRKRIFVASQAIGLFAASMLVFNFCGVPFVALLNLGGDYNSRLMYGWDTIAAEVQTLAQDLGHGPLLITTNYRSASQLAFALNNPAVLAISERVDQFDVLIQQRQTKHKDAILVADDRHPLPEDLLARFAQTSDPIEVPIFRWGVAIQTYYLYQAYNLDAAASLSKSMPIEALVRSGKT
jgi:hypothetical protein